MTALPSNRVLVVTYNLKGAANSYAQFYEALKSQGAWWHYLPSTWLIYTGNSPQQVASAARAHLQEGDHLFVGTLQNGYSGWLPKDAWEWIRGKGLSS